MRLPSEAKTPEERQSIIRENFAKVAGWTEKAARRQGLIHPTRRNAHPERDIQNAILRWLALKGICHVRLEVNAAQMMVGGKWVRKPSTMRGWPDILCVYGRHGTAIGLEVKATTNQSEEQKAVEEYITRANGIYRVVRSLEEVESLFKELSE